MLPPGGRFVSSSPKSEQRLPVAVISGFAGSGKTTLIDRILHNPEGRRIAAIINANDVSADGRLMKGTRLKHHKDVIELKNGCVCCSLRDDLAERLRQLASSNR